MNPALKSAIDKLWIEAKFKSSIKISVLSEYWNIGCRDENQRLQPIIERLTLALTLAMERFNKYETLPDIPGSPEANTAVLIIRTNAIADAADVLAILEG